MFLQGKPGRPPLQMTAPQAGLHAGAEAAATSMLAHLERERTGLGQKIVVSMQACVTWTTMNETPFPILHGDILRRSGDMSGSPAVARRDVWPCADGHVVFKFSGGPYSHTASTIVAWMDELGMAPDWLRSLDVSTWVSARFATDVSPEFMAEVRAAEDAIMSFLKGMTRREIYRYAVDRDLLLAFVATAEDIAEDDQLAAREYFQTVYQPALDRELTLVGPFAKMTATPLVEMTPAPTLGQHNSEILGGELGVQSEELQFLFSKGVI
jgi:crotonobetainyl-CoA:carnitine CoA-transferase CaiB-like acyl-CoA transferase